MVPFTLQMPPTQSRLAQSLPSTRQTHPATTRSQQTPPLYKTRPTPTPALKRQHLHLHPPHQQPPLQPSTQPPFQRSQPASASRAPSPSSEPSPARNPRHPPPSRNPTRPCTRSTSINRISPSRAACSPARPVRGIHSSSRFFR
ncbi:hypothetical protein BJY00DRAFT_280028 [Aspergillus carlsbadensis]|nr:hypothetical protein BJY00DRAFT_280028 [Aspergillus carlsbadensis]